MEKHTRNHAACAPARTAFLGKGARLLKRGAAVSGIALASLLGFGATAQAAPEAYWTTAATCSGPVASVPFTPGGTVTASLCATGVAAGQYICNSDMMLEADSTSDGLFAVTNRTLNPALGDSIATLVSPYSFPVTNPASLPDWGGLIPVITAPVDPAGNDVLLATFTFAVDSGATGICPSKVVGFEGPSRETGRAARSR
jgi:hypothetical protein